MPGVEGVGGHRTDLNALHRHTALVAQVPDKLVPLDVDVTETGPDGGSAVPKGTLGLDPGFVDADRDRFFRLMRVAKVADGVVVVVKLHPS